MWRLSGRTNSPPGQDHDAPHGRALLKGVGPQPEGRFLVADRADEGDQTRQLAFDLDYTPVIPPKSNRKQPWAYDREAYKKRNEVERLIRRLKGYRRVFSRYDKLDIERARIGGEIHQLGCDLGFDTERQLHPQPVEASLCARSNPK